MGQEVLQECRVVIFSVGSQTEDLCQVGAGVNATFLGSLNQAVQNCADLSSSGGICKEDVLPADDKRFLRSVLQKL